jgi:hypothetical protein
MTPRFIARMARAWPFPASRPQVRSSNLQLCPGARRLTLLLVALALATGHALAGTVLVYRNAGWRMTDWKYHAGTTPPAGGRDAWRLPDFDDAAWPVAKGAFGYGVPSRLGLTLKDMKGAHSTLYLRTTFTVSDQDFVWGLRDLPAAESIVVPAQW